LGIALLACATEENDFPSPSELTTGDDNAGASAGAGFSGGGGSSSVGGGSSGSFATGGVVATSGAGTGGTFGSGGSASFGGTFSTSGGGTGGAPSGGGGGKASGGTGGVGGKASGGSGGKASGGAGGGGNAQCGGSIPAKTTWKGSALPEANDAPPSNVFDGDDTTRFTTGQPQMGGEWLEIDFGASVTINQITMHTNNNDYFRHYQLRLSNTANDAAAAILKEDDGMTGTITVTLPQTHSGRFLNIRQAGMVTPTWWSLHEVSVACK